MKIDLTKKVVTALARIDGTLKHTEKLDAIARIFGLTDQTTLMAALKSSGAVHTGKGTGDAPHPYEGVPDAQRKWSIVIGRKKSSSAPDTDLILQEIIYARMFALRQKMDFGYAYADPRNLDKDDALVYDEQWSREAYYVSKDMSDFLDRIYKTMENVIVKYDEDDIFGNPKSFPVFPWVLRVPRLKNMGRNWIHFLPEDLLTAFRDADEHVQKMIDEALKGKDFQSTYDDVKILENLKISISRNFYDSETLMESFAPQK